MNQTIRIRSQEDVLSILEQLEANWQDNTSIFVNGNVSCVFKSDLTRSDDLLEVGKTYTLSRMGLYYHNPQGMDGADIWSFAEVDFDE